LKSLGSKHQPRKRFGQNFLIDHNIIEQILTVVDPQPQDHLVEIGPGLGAITERLLPPVAHLDAIELDRDLIAFLTEKFGADTNKFTLYNADVLRFDLNTLARPPHKFRIVGNIPYNISTPLIFHLLSFAEHIVDIHLMVQKEVAVRLNSQHGSKAYGRLSIMIQHCCQVTQLFDIGPEAFDPPPAVNSAFIRITPDPVKAAATQNIKLLRNITTAAFNQRRKTIQNALKSLRYHTGDSSDNSIHHGVSAETLLAAGITPTLRPEQVSVEDYVRLSNILVQSVRSWHKA